MKATSIKTAEHYVWGGVCDGWHLLKNPGLSVIQERMPPGTSEVRHFHSVARQFFYILSGTAVLEFEESTVRFGPGEAVEVPPGVLHRFANESADDLEFLVISSPPTAADRTNVPLSIR